MLKKNLTLGIGATLLLAASGVNGQNIPPALLDNPNFVVFEIGSPQQRDSQQGSMEAIGEAVEGNTSAGDPTNTPIITSRFSIMRVTTALRSMNTTAGADSKEVVVPDAPASCGLSVYAEFDWSAIEDNRGFNLDGNKFAPRIGADFVIGPEIVVGGSFTYAYERRNSHSVALRTEESAYVFNGYAGKTFMDWINVGVTMTYAYEHQITKAFGTTIYGKNNVFAISPFLGVSHTFGAWSFSSTGAYIYQYNDIEYDTNPPLGLGGNLDSHFYLHINELEYALTDKLSVGANVNFNVVISEQQNALAATVGTTDDFWVTVGGKVSLQMFDYITGSVQFQADVDNQDYDNYLTSVGITWSF